MKTFKVWAVFALVGVMACGGDDDGGGGTLGEVSTNPQVYCQAYQDMCPYGDVQECLDDCNGVVDPGTEESCWFKTCGVATGYCDNEVSGDPQIIACADAQGWYDACGALESNCANCSDANNIRMCEDTVAAGIALDCANLRASLSDLPSGC